MIEEYYNNLKILRSLENIFSRKNNFLNKKNIEKDVDDLKKTIKDSPKKDGSPKKELKGDYKNIDGLNSSQQKVVDEFIENNSDSDDIKKLTEEIRDKASGDWRPSNEFISFYKDVSKGGSESIDIYDVSSLFLGVDRDYLEKAKVAASPVSWLFSNIFIEFFPEAYYTTLERTFSTIKKSIPKETSVMFYKKFVENMGGEKELAKSVLKIGTKDEYSGTIEYEGESVTLSSGEANRSRINISQALLSALLSITWGVSDSEKERLMEGYIQFPLERYRISSKYGNRVNPNNKSKRQDHKGLDLAANMYSEIRPIMHGKVIKTGDSKGGGLYIKVEHNNGYTSSYMHCSIIKKNEGDIVGIDDVIALVGKTGNATGPHLHLEVKKDGEYIDPLEILRE